MIGSGQSTNPNLLNYDNRSVKEILEFRSEHKSQSAKLSYKILNSQIEFRSEHKSQSAKLTHRFELMLIKFRSEHKSQSAKLS